MWRPAPPDRLIWHVLRGYEKFEEKLANLGATVAFGAETTLRG